MDETNDTRETSQIRVDPKLLRRVKIEAAKRGLSMKDLVQLACEAYLSKRPA